jgi:hypothetical protein
MKIGISAGLIATLILWGGCSGDSAQRATVDSASGVRADSHAGADSGAARTAANDIGVDAGAVASSAGRAASWETPQRPDAAVPELVSVEQLCVKSGSTASPPFVPTPDTDCVDAACGKACDPCVGSTDCVSSGAYACDLWQLCIEVKGP